jgi:hypothetical protein
MSNTDIAIELAQAQLDDEREEHLDKKQMRLDQLRQRRCSIDRD